MRADVSEALNANTDAFQHWNGRVPIMLGACGHRNIGTSDTKLIAAVKEQCKKLREKYRHSPFIILSALAEGADRLVAQIAMDELSAELIAVLPMPEKDYERDFGPEELKAAFRVLLKRALYLKIAPLPAGDTSWMADGETRNEQYARAGAIVTGHAQILFSIWDGKPARGTGGTADQVTWFERGYSCKEYSLYKDAISPLDPAEPGLSIRIDPVSAEVTVAKDPASKGRRQSGARSNIQSILARTDRYNRDVLRYKRRIAKSKPLVTEALGNIRDFAITDSVQRASDTLSVHFANKVRSSDAVIYFLALGAVLAFNFVSSKAGAPWVYLGITFVMAMLAGRVWFRFIDNRFLEYRCLAEATRTLFFWRNAGLKRPLWITYLSRQLGVMHWVRHAVRSVEFCQDCHLPVLEESSHHSNGVRIAKTCWVDDQMGWFAQKEHYHSKRSKFWKRISRVAIVASFATAIALALLTRVPYGTDGSLWDQWVKPDALWRSLAGRAWPFRRRRGCRSRLPIAAGASRTDKAIRIAKADIRNCEQNARHYQSWFEAVMDSRGNSWEARRGSIAGAG